MSAIEGTRPRDGEARVPVEATPVEAIGGLVARARDAGFDHAARPLAERAGLLRTLADAILADGEAIVALLAEETGKPAAEAWLHEVVPTADLGSWWSSHGPAHLATEAVRLDPLAYPGKRARVEVVPRGVVALITPWNFPVAIPLRTLFPALLAGNGVVWKPSEHTPRVAARVHGIVREVFGPDLVELVQGAGAQGAALVEADVDAVVFTGSVATGRKVGAAAGRALRPASLELGGKDAAVVLEDADLERTARGLLWAAMANAGQNCAGLERVYAVAEVAGPLKARLGELAGELVPGRDVGPLVTEAQLATVERHVREAIDGGAEVLAGGERLERGGRWFAPTVLAEVDPSSAALSEETFGPVVVVQTVADEAAAVAAANDSRFGLTASVWTRDAARGEAVARRLRAGVVTVNNHAFTGAIPALPWGGVGETGFGVTNSPHALHALVRPRAVVVDGNARPELYWHPYDEALERLGKGMAALRGKGGPITKVRAVARLLGALRRRF